MKSGKLVRIKSIDLPKFLAGQMENKEPIEQAWYGDEDVSVMQDRTVNEAFFSDSEIDEEDEDKTITLTSNTLKIIHCGTTFINGIYHRVSGTSFVRKCRHPITNRPLKLEITQIDLQPLFEEKKIYHQQQQAQPQQLQLVHLKKVGSPTKGDRPADESKKYPWMPSPNTYNYNKAFVIRSIYPCPVEIHYYICRNDGDAAHWLPVAGLKPTPTVSPINDMVHFFRMPFYPVSTWPHEEKHRPEKSGKKGILQQEIDRQKEESERKIEIKQWHKHLPV
ncbi:hypothetical protein RFI_28843 [Reticulomyxa filosa]|uniref:Uncharacterized protein n=1 Tax=Reticulomyxa filosa TaxID=46433 RepID=X6M4H5_RETFI|nr:hypothetical protein RFI_28843 [Reticulomyxa filosa]|eukprot:ETO08546.1 hypothetical protein RFI_28843 [Reticulomyxa filosa]